MEHLPLPVNPLRLETALIVGTSPYGQQIEVYANRYPLVTTPNPEWLNFRRNIWYSEGLTHSSEILLPKVRFFDPIFEQFTLKLMEGGHVILVEENHPDDILMHMWFLSLISQNNIVLHRSSSLGEAGSGTLLDRAQESKNVANALGLIPMIPGGIPDGQHEQYLKNYEHSLRNQLNIAVPNRLLDLLHHFKIHQDQESRFLGLKLWRQKLDNELAGIDPDTRVDYLQNRLLQVDGFVNLGANMAIYIHGDHPLTEPILSALRPDVGQVQGLVEPTVLVTNQKIKWMEQIIFQLFSSQLKHIENGYQKGNQRRDLSNALRYVAFKPGKN